MGCLLLLLLLRWYRSRSSWTSDGALLEELLGWQASARKKQAGGGSGPPPLFRLPSRLRALLENPDVRRAAWPDVMRVVTAAPVRSAQVQKVGVGIGEDFKQLDREHPGL